MPVLNDPARGIDTGATLDLCRNRREFAACGQAVLFLSSEIEEALHLCTQVPVFRRGTVSASFPPPMPGDIRAISQPLRRKMSIDGA